MRNDLSHYYDVRKPLHMENLPHGTPDAGSIGNAGRYPSIDNVAQGHHMSAMAAPCIEHVTDDFIKTIEI